MASRDVCATLPTTTWSTSSGATPDCSSAALAATTARSVAVRSFSAPPKMPKGVRFTARKTISVSNACFIASFLSSHQKLPKGQHPPKEGGGGEQEFAHRPPPHRARTRPPRKEATAEIHERLQAASRGGSVLGLHHSTVCRVDVPRGGVGEAARAERTALRGGKAVIRGEHEGAGPRLGQEIEPRIPSARKDDGPVPFRLVRVDALLHVGGERPALRDPPDRYEA